MWTQNSNAMADALLWIMHAQGVRLALHYLDDFIILVGPPFETHLMLDIGFQTCAELGWDAHKIEGPFSCLVFLGIEIDS